MSAYSRPARVRTERTSDDAKPRLLTEEISQVQVKWLRREETSPLQDWNGGEATAACPPTPHASMLGLVRTSGDLRNFRWPGTPPFSNCRPLARNNIEAGGQRGARTAVANALVT